MLVQLQQSTTNYRRQRRQLRVANQVTVTPGQLMKTTEMSSSDTSDDRKRIKVAASNGQLKAVIELSTKFSGDVKLLSETLVRSCRWGHLDVVKWMVEHTAADVNYTAVIRETFKWGEEVDRYFTPLTAACTYTHLDVLKYLVKTSRVDVNLSDNSKWGYTPLITACAYYSMSLSMYLLSEVSDLDVNIADNKGFTALHFAVSCSKDDGYTQLHLACIKGDVTEVMRLVNVDDHMINAQNNAGYTPLHWACRLGHGDIVKILMLAGADETITNNGWLTPAQVAELCGHPELLKLLNRQTLWAEKQTNNFNKLTVRCHLVMLTFKLMKLKLILKNWCQVFSVVHIALTIKHLT